MATKMADEKVVEILLSKTDLPEDEIRAMTAAEAWGLVYKDRKGTGSPNSLRETRLQVCITGCRASEEQEMISLAESKGMKVRTGVTKKLDFLVTGDNPGPSKLKKADEQGVQIMSCTEFREMLETGEVGA